MNAQLGGELQENADRTVLSRKMPLSSLLIQLEDLACTRRSLRSVKSPQNTWR
ncbi:hypothetical protein ACFSO0_13210 [Brevibacillus sp. GCM10020057]|uniref:hypothetical protein n=1 Tax=Brevibacillus sp. GCM10020057 TaxID=3317327 RepID=UPI0036429B35